MNDRQIAARFGACRHATTVSVITAGLERVVCEDCGNVTIRYESAISGEIDRSRFARDADSSRARREQGGKHEVPATGHDSGR